MKKKSKLEVIIVIFILAIILFMATSWIKKISQSRSVSRLTGNSLELTLPEDLHKPISFSSGREGEKDLFYYTKSGELKVHTYTDSGFFQPTIIFKVKDKK